MDKTYATAEIRNLPSGIKHLRSIIIDHTERTMTYIGENQQDKLIIATMHFTLHSVHKVPDKK